MIIQSVNQSFNQFTTKVTQPTADAILYDDNGYQLMWDATAKWFKWIPANTQNYDTGYLRIASNIAPGGVFAPVNKRGLAKETPIWLGSDPSRAPIANLTSASFASISGIIECLQNDLKSECDLIFSIDVNIKAPAGTSASITADSFITSFVKIAVWK